MRVDVFDSMEWLFPDSCVREKPRRKVRLESARGTRPGFQILVTDVGDGTTLRASVSPLKRAHSGVLRETELFHLLSVPVEENTAPDIFTERGKANPFVTRRAPFRVFDVLRPMEGDSPALAGANAILVQIPVSPRVRPGLYSGTATVAAGGESVSINIEVNVHRATVPRCGHLRITNWFSLENMALRHGLKLWSPGHWGMIEKYARLMARNRQNMFWAPLSLIERKKVRGKWRFDFERWERLIRTFLGAGHIWIEGGHLAFRSGWDASRFHIPGFRDILATGPEGYIYLSALLTEIKRVLERNRWKWRYVQHLADEPHGPDVADYRVLASIARKFLGDVRFIDAVQDSSLGGAVDVWVLLNSQYEEKRAEWEIHRSLGDELWHYTCCAPGGRYLNRLLDQSLLRPRLLHWGNYFYDLKGYLHWGLNHYRPDQNPFEQSVVWHSGSSKLPPGDTHIVYPGADGPWSSMRFEAMREGIEDYELLLRLASLEKRLADRLTRQVFRGFADYTEDIRTFRRTHIRLLTALSSVRGR